MGERGAEVAKLLIVPMILSTIVVLRVISSLGSNRVWVLRLVTYTRNVVIEHQALAWRSGLDEWILRR